MSHDVVVYVVDDDGCARDAMRLLLMTVGLNAEAFESPLDFVEKFDPHRPGCVILDLRMPELNGIETLIRLQERSKTVPVIFLTGHGDLSTVVRAMKLGAVDFFEKPVSNELLLESIQHWVLAHAVCFGPSRSYTAAGASDRRVVAVAEGAVFFLQGAPFQWQKRHSRTVEVPPDDRAAEGTALLRDVQFKFPWQECAVGEDDQCAAGRDVAHQAVHARALLIVGDLGAQVGDLTSFVTTLSGLHGHCPLPFHGIWSQRPSRSTRKHP